MPEIPRRLRTRIDRALSAFRVTVVTGPRQSGKTTLVGQVLDGRDGALRSLDDDRLLAAALVDPVGFTRYGPPPRAIDEFQLGGDALVRAVKLHVDADRTPGQFLLTGSADFLTVPGISESLAGRAVLFTLWPFSQGEIHGAPDGFLDLAFHDPEALRSGRSSGVQPEDYLAMICAGGYPEAIRMDGTDRADWFDSLVSTVTQRDIADVTGARRSSELPGLLRLLAARTAGEVVVSQVQADSGLARGTVDDYIGFLRMTYLVHELPAWSTSHATRAKRRPKIFLTDTGLACHFLGADPGGLLRPEDRRRGPLTETFVVNELTKQLGWTRSRVKLHHFRDTHAEIDVVAETPDGRIVAIEVKSGLSVTAKSFKHMAALRDKLGDAFVHGYVLHYGDIPLSFGDRLTALPLSYLWQAG
ncbi:ATP-binding protein [Sphaerisporangium sp. NPDC088356]|uniref:ATP-binding protein n=1 Tax=Sphaerisporangium sp. NPDC088356 TaxID=3154871 RepID=UPI0034387809